MLGNWLNAVALALVVMMAAADRGHAAGFAEHQRRAPRVEAARQAKGAAVAAMFKAAGVAYPAPLLLLRAFKHEAQLELWAGTATAPLRLITSYRICAPSGGPGPKRARGDLQVPEGFYRIDRFNPASNFHLSLGIDYPNASDRLLGRKGAPGGDIFIHGECVTIGCIPIENGPIEELYLAALDTFLAGSKQIPVHIFPRRMDAAGMAALEQAAVEDAALWSFWQSLAPVFRYFEAHRRVPRVRVHPVTGAYSVAEEDS